MAETVDNPGDSRFEIRSDGERAGFVDYRLRGGTISLLHTEIDDRFEGQGLGSLLVRSVLDNARERGLEVLPYCPFVRSWIARHPDYLELVPEGRSAEFDL
ncbi:N-acetyltransferase [Saccharopolyspora erythraea]|uniref:GNAT family N-acetyltransferase n=1 Tax=Saccharopolyspora erythraea TaxID=1836 RepID=UPI001BAC61A4|nr:GNAT family N-acetyltransferase [Saccharopolyspora erythraea]QUH02650.1 N-acetyltransferase [Saccharopolyspora erythraea]